MSTCLLAISSRLLTAHSGLLSISSRLLTIVSGDVTSPESLWTCLRKQNSFISLHPPARWQSICDQATLPKAVSTGAFINNLESLFQTKDRPVPFDLHLESAVRVAQAALLEDQMQQNMETGLFTACATLDFQILCPAYMVSRLIARELGFDGPRGNIEATCSSGYLTLVAAFQSISEGAYDVAVAAASSLTIPTNGFLTERMDFLSASLLL